MNTLTTMKCAAVLLPALAIGMPMANASDEDCDCPCQDERTTAMVGQDRDQHSERGQHGRDQQSERERQRTEQRQAATRMQDREDASERAGASARAGQQDFLETIPPQGYQSDSLIGHEIVNRSTNESIGTVNNLLLDEDGQVVAVIVGVGGVLGIGERDVAISWDQIERTADSDSDGDFRLSVDMSEERLKDAPKYSKDSEYSRSRN